MLNFQDLWDNLEYDNCYILITDRKTLRKLANIAGFRSEPEQGTYIEFLQSYGGRSKQLFQL